MPDKLLAFNAPLGGGMNIGTNQFMISDNQDVLTLNVITRPSGTYRQRDGYQTIHEVNSGEEITSVFQHCIKGESNIFAISKNRLWSATDSVALEPIAGELVSSFADVELFYGTILIADTDVLKYYNEVDGRVDSLNTLGTEVNAPKASFIDAYKNRVFLSGNPDKPYTLYASNIIDPSKGLKDIKFIDTNVPTNTIDPAADDPYWLNIPFTEDCSSGIIGQEEFDDKLYLFSNQEIFLWPGRTLDSLVPVTVSEGALNDYAIAKTKFTLAYMGQHGIYRVIGNRIEEIHIPVQWYVDHAQKEKVKAMGYNDFLFFYIGDVPLFDYVLEDEMIKDACLVYDTLTQAWTIWDNVDATAFGTRYLANSSYLMFGSKSNKIFEFRPEHIDDAEQKNINVEIRTKTYYLGSPISKKSLDYVFLSSENAMGTEISVRGLTFQYEDDYVDIAEYNNVYGIYKADSAPKNQRGYQMKIQKIKSTEKVTYHAWGMVYTPGALLTQ